ncbi:MAG: hypothetical protein EOP54_22590 [Sphingobacteriales bacterium]|nr:MAG: hypothetical protein EOP54_22590 [Sphingobacteriales bacterium]
MSRVFLSFNVETDGRLTNYKVHRSLFKETAAEAIRVMKLSPKWIPAKENGKAVRCKFTVPVSIGTM